MFWVLDGRAKPLTRRDALGIGAAAAAGNCEMLVRSILACGKAAPSQMGDVVMAYAAKNGHSVLVMLCLVSGQASDLNWALVWAARGGHKDIVRLLHGRGASAFVGGLARAAAGGHEDIMRLMHAWGNVRGAFCDWALARAASKGQVRCMALARDWGAANFDWALLKAIEGGHRSAAALCKTWGATGVLPPGF